MAASVVVVLLLLLFLFTAPPLLSAIGGDNNEKLQLENEMKLVSEEKHWLAADVPTSDWAKLTVEFRSVREDMVFGLVSDAESFEVRIGLLRLWCVSAWVKAHSNPSKN